MSDLDELALEGLRELEELFYIPPREKGDLDIRQIAKRLKINKSTAKMKMDELIKAGEWHSVDVRGVNNLPTKVYRKGPKPDEEK